MHLEFLVDNYAAATSAANKANQVFGGNLDALMLITWANVETWYGRNGISTNNSNFFNQRVGTNWVNQANCSSNAVSGWACFGSFADPAISALFSPIAYANLTSADGIATNRPSAGFILADQFQSGSDVGQAFQALATGSVQSNGKPTGWDGGNPLYGSRFRTIRNTVRAGLQSWDREGEGACSSRQIHYVLV